MQTVLNSQKREVDNGKEKKRNPLRRSILGRGRETYESSKGYTRNSKRKGKR